MDRALEVLHSGVATLEGHAHGADEIAVSDDAAAALGLNAGATVEEGLRAEKAALDSEIAKVPAVAGAKPGRRYQAVIDKDCYLFDHSLGIYIYPGYSFNVINDEFYAARESTSTSVFALYEFGTNQKVSGIDYTYCENYAGYDPETGMVYFAKISSGSTYNGTNYLVQINPKTGAKKVVTVSITQSPDQYNGLVGFSANYLIFQWSSNNYYEFVILNKKTFQLYKKLNLNGAYMYNRTLVAVNPEEDAIYYARGYAEGHMYRYDIETEVTTQYGSVPSWSSSTDYFNRFLLADFDVGCIIVIINRNSTYEVWKIDIRTPNSAAVLLYNFGGNNTLKFPSYAGHLDDMTSLWCASMSVPSGSSTITQGCAFSVDNYNFSSPKELLKFRPSNDDSELMNFGYYMTEGPNGKNKITAPRFLFARRSNVWDTKDMRLIINGTKIHYGGGYTSTSFFRAADRTGRRIFSGPKSFDTDSITIYPTDANAGQFDVSYIREYIEGA